MEFTQLLRCAAASICLVGVATAGPIQDPIADYLAMQVPDRSEYVGTLDFLQRVKVDVDGDGSDEVFVGTWYRYSGSKEAYYYAGYRQKHDGYARITSANADVQISSFETIFAGSLQEISKQGLAEARDIEVDSPQSGNATKVGMLTFYYIANGHLVEELRAALNLAVPVDKIAYERYFGEKRVTRKATIATFSRDQLQQMGYSIPNWEPAQP